MSRLNSFLSSAGAAAFLGFGLLLTGLMQTASAQTGFTGIFGGGPLYINAANNVMIACMRC